MHILLQAEKTALNAFDEQQQPEKAFRLVALWAQVEMLHLDYRKGEETHLKVTRLLQSNSSVLSLALEYIDADAVKEKFGAFLDAADIQAQDIFATLRALKRVFDHMLVISASAEISILDETHDALYQELRNWMVADPNHFAAAGTWFANQYLLFDLFLDTRRPHLDNHRMLLDYMANELDVERGQWWGHLPEVIERLIALSNEEDLRYDD